MPATGLADLNAHGVSANALQVAGHGWCLDAEKTGCFLVHVMLALRCQRVILFLIIALGAIAEAHHRQGINGTPGRRADHQTGQQA